MNEQFIKTIQALEVAKKEMHSLHNTIDKLESINMAEWHETQTISNYQRDLDYMVEIVAGMLAKRENELLEKVRAQQSVHPTRAGVGSNQLSVIRPCG